MKHGKLFLVSAPSGAGKTTLVQQVIKLIGVDYALEKVITYTTKEPRPGEVPGTDYHFLSEQEFKERISQGFFVEYSTAYGAYYGFPVDVFSYLKTGRNFMGIVDIAGAQSIRAYSEEPILIGVTPPDVASLKERLTERAEDTAEAIAYRLGLAQHELEVINGGLFDHLIINDTFERAVKSLEAIVKEALSLK